MDKGKNSVVHKILDIEVDMFRRVPTGEEPACRAHLDDMKLHRRGQFSTWSLETCRSYLQDLERAKERETNLMTIKYARIDNLIPPYSENSLINKIAETFKSWQREILDKYPNIMRGGRDIEEFTGYLRAELETYSDETLELLHRDVDKYKQKGQNMSIQVYESLAKQSGYESIDELEAVLRKE